MCTPDLLIFIQFIGKYFVLQTFDNILYYTYIPNESLFKTTEVYNFTVHIKTFFCSARVEKLFNVVLHLLNNTIIGGLSQNGMSFLFAGLMVKLLKLIVTYLYFLLMTSAWCFSLLLPLLSLASATLQKKEACTQFFALEKSFKICYVCVKRK